MPKLKITVPHSLEQQDALTRMQGYLTKLKNAYPDRVNNLTEEWVGNVLNFGFSAMGFGVNGAMTVGDKDVTVDADLPFAAMMFKGKIEQAVRDELTRVLSSEKRPPKSTA
jgi:hypothetical protein